MVAMYVVGQVSLTSTIRVTPNSYRFLMFHGSLSLWISLLIFHLPKVLMPFLLLWMSSLRWHFLPCTKTIISEEIAYNVKREVFQHHGLLDYIISVQGPQFVLKFWKNMSRPLQIDCKHYLSHHVTDKYNGAEPRRN